MAALIVPPKSQMSLEEIFADIEEIRKRAKPHKGFSTKDFIEEGRR